MKKRIAVLIGLSLILGMYILFKEHLSLEGIKAQQHYLQALVHDHYALSVVVFVLLYTCAVAISLPTGGIFTLIAGFLFGFLPAVIYTLLSATSGAVIAFLMTRYFFADALERRYPQRIVRLNHELRRYGAHYLLMVRFMNFIPFVLVNVLAGLTKVRLSTFAWTAAVGNLPATVAIALAGSQLAHIQSLRDIFSYRLMSVFVMLAVLAVVPMLLARFVLKKESYEEVVEQ